MFLWWIDHWEREPWYLIAGAFFWGAVPSIILAAIFQYFLMMHLFSAAVFYVPHDATMMAVVVAPITEESFKAIALLILFLFLWKEIDSLLDGFIYGAAVGFGFAAVENITYFFRAAGELDLFGVGLIVLLRTFVFGTNHAIFTGLTGLGFALARFRKTPVTWLGFPLLGLCLAILLHGLHNFLALWSGLRGDSYAGLIPAILVHAIALLGVVALLVTSLIVQGSWVRHYLAEEVEAGVLTQAQADVAGSFAMTRRLHGEGRRFNRLSVDLAMKKHAYARAGEQGQSMEEIEAIRRQLTDLSRRAREARRSN